MTTALGTARRRRVVVNKHLGLKDSPNKRRSYMAWRNMLERTTNPRHPEYRNYGDRGITVCDEWKTFAGFYASIGDIPAGMSIERTDVNSGYFADNCRLIPTSHQQKNRRNTVWITHDGRTQCLTDWAREFSVGSERLRYFLVKRGFCMDEALAVLQGRASLLRKPKKGRQPRVGLKKFGLPRKGGRKPKQGPPRPPRTPWRGDLITFGGITLTREEWAESLGDDLSKYEVAS